MEGQISPQLRSSTNHTRHQQSRGSRLRRSMDKVMLKNPRRKVRRTSFAASLQTFDLLLHFWPFGVQVVCGAGAAIGLGAGAGAAKTDAAEVVRRAATASLKFIFGDGSGVCRGQDQESCHDSFYTADIYLYKKIMLHAR